MRELSPLEQRLSLELRAIRTQAGMSQAAMAAQVGTSQKTASRIESTTDDRLPDRAELVAWIRDADEDVQARLHVLFDAAHVEAQSWDALRRDGHIQGVGAEDEAVATLVCCYTSGFVPGLLQTDEYARRLMPLVDPTGDVAAAVQARMQRQQRLYDEHRRFEFLLAESALAWSPGSAVMAAQRDRLISAATLTNVEVRILPALRAGEVAWHDFILWSAESIPSWVTVEMAHALARTADPDLVQIYEGRWSRLWGAAVRGEEAVELIRQA